jgi:hypothetical protein
MAASCEASVHCLHWWVIPRARAPSVPLLDVEVQRQAVRKPMRLADPFLAPGRQGT